MIYRIKKAVVVKCRVVHFNRLGDDEEGKVKELGPPAIEIDVDHFMARFDVTCEEHRDLFSLPEAEYSLMLVHCVTRYLWIVLPDYLCI